MDFIQLVSTIKQLRLQVKKMILNTLGNWLITVFLKNQLIILQSWTFRFILCHVGAHIFEQTHFSLPVFRSAKKGIIFFHVSRAAFIIPFLAKLQLTNSVDFRYVRNSDVTRIFHCVNDALWFRKRISRGGGNSIYNTFSMVFRLNFVFSLTFKKIFDGKDIIF